MKELCEKEFILEEYINEKTINNQLAIKKEKTVQVRFEEICQNVKLHFEKEWESANSNYENILLEHKRAIIGHEREVAYFKERIREYLNTHNLLKEWKPKWYLDIVDGVYHELWGMASLGEWFTEKYKDSSSAKVVGDRIYFLINGKAALMPQQIDSQRRKQLIKALLLNTPKKRFGDNYHEVYMLDGSRITIFTGELVKPNQEVLVFRKFLVKEYTFEKQAELGTIPVEAIPLFISMIKIGYNVVFTGAVRTAKTTFLSTWQSYENPELEGVMIETDPEIPVHNLLPSAPILQLVADGEALESITKSTLRSDADYIIMAEARDGVALNIAVRAANKGTRRVKMTFHTTDTLDFCYDIADEIVRIYGGSLYSTMIKVAKSFQFIFHFIQLQDKSKKRLKAIYNIEYENSKISFNQICKYNIETDSWQWDHHIGKCCETIGHEESPRYLEIFNEVLKELSNKSPIMEQTEFIPYKHLEEK